MIQRLKLAWHVLRGRPLIYGVTFDHAVHIAPGAKDLLIKDCIVVGPILSPEEQARANEIGWRLKVQREALRQAKADG